MNPHCGSHNYKVYISILIADTWKILSPIISCLQISDMAFNHVQIIHEETDF